MSVLLWRCITALFVGLSLLFGLDAGRRCCSLEREVVTLRNLASQQADLITGIVANMHSLNRQLDQTLDIVSRVEGKAQRAVDQLTAISGHNSPK